ncbi:receptor activity-modifying protein 1-like isoform X2 [Trichomycterus rosablanca]|uniref:receptor activity-modifying protein 1-like isoform X2 n=1 Tax=Trichomycterus rosablanca TaxID=2290929 RepID=UPI002F351977
MLLVLSGLLLPLLLDPSFISGQTTDGNVNRSQGAVNFTLKDDGAVNVILEDDESFQNQEQMHHYHRCDENLLKTFGEEFCWYDIFDVHMMEIDKGDWCNWEMVLSAYNNLTVCLEQLAGYAKCYYPNAVVQDLFVKVHKQYFSSCGTREDALPDAPPGVVLILTLLPVSIIPILVYMVIWKSSMPSSTSCLSPDICF